MESCLDTSLPHLFCDHPSLSARSSEQSMNVGDNVFKFQRYHHKYPKRVISMTRSTLALFIFFWAVRQASLSPVSLLKFPAPFHPSRYLKYLLFYDSQKRLLFCSRQLSDTKQLMPLIVKAIRTQLQENRED